MFKEVVHRTCIRRSSLNQILKISQCSMGSDTNTEQIVRSHLPDIEIPNVSLPEFIFENWSRFPNRIALECAATGKKLTFEKLRRKSFAFSASLQKKIKLQKGDVIGALLPNTPEYAVCILGALLAGVTVTTLTPLYTIEEIARHLKETEVKAIITFSPLVPSVQKLHTRLPIIAVKANLAESLPTGVIHFNELVEDLDAVEDLPIQFNEVALMPSSSGTTGLPKAVELTHKSIVSNLCQYNQPTYSDIVTSTADFQAVVPGILPFFHVAGLLPTLLSSMRYMCKLVTVPKFQPETFINILETYKPSFLVVVPYVVSFLANNPNVKEEHFEGMKAIASSAGPVSLYEEDRVHEKSKHRLDILQAYGMTEATALMTLGGKKNTGSYKSCGSVGKPLQNTLIKVVDENGKSLGPNQPGELLIKGPQIMKGYHKKPKQTQEAFVEGWLRSGDVGYYDENSIFYITERIKELIKVKGYQVAPAELEFVIREHPKVLEAAVIGIPHSTYGEVPRAYVVLQGQANANAKEIEEFVAAKVSNYKQLKGGVAFVESIPKAASGKILRSKLKDRYGKGEI